MDVSSSSSERERAGERNQIIDEVRVRRSSKGGRESGPYFIADTVHANVFVLGGSSFMFAPAQSFMKRGHHSPFPLFAMKQAWIGHNRNAVWFLISLIILQERVDALDRQIREGIKNGPMSLRFEISAAYGGWLDGW